MKAFLLAGGLGQRLRPLTDTMPKCLVPINGEPLLALWLTHLASQGVSDVLINVSRHVEQVERLVTEHHWGMSIRVEKEAEPRGSAGTVAACRDFVATDDSFYVLYADNLTDVPFAPLLAAHQRHDDPMTIGLFHAPVPQAAGIVQLSGDGRIVAFEEKPERPTGDLANAGFYVARQSVFDHIPLGRPIVDFGHDVMPRLVGRMHGIVLDGFLADVGTPASLTRAAALWATHRPKALHS